MAKTLHNKRSVVQCPYGCCKVHVTNKTLRAREARTWKDDHDG